MVDLNTVILIGSCLFSVINCFLLILLFSILLHLLRSIKDGVNNLSGIGLIINDIYNVAIEMRDIHKVSMCHSSKILNDKKRNITKEEYEIKKKNALIRKNTRSYKKD